MRIKAMNVKPLKSASGYSDDILAIDHLFKKKQHWTVTDAAAIKQHVSDGRRQTPCPGCTVKSILYWEDSASKNKQSYPLYSETRWAVACPELLGESITWEIQGGGGKTQSCRDRRCPV